LPLCQTLGFCLYQGRISWTWHPLTSLDLLVSEQVTMNCWLCLNTMRAWSPFV
jgi:hypothetical protein